MRININEWAMSLAFVVAKRATCDRKHVGAVLLDQQGHVVSTGYNGAPHGMPHCDDVGHELKDIGGKQSCVRTLHAESNALDYAGPMARNCNLYVTVIPCYDCAKRIVQAGIISVFYEEYYQSRNTELVEGYLEESNVSLFQVDTCITSTLY